MKRIERKHSRILCTYTDKYSVRIQTVHQNVWKRLESSARGLDEVKAQLPRDLLDPEVTLNGPGAFGLRVFRRMNVTPGRQSWYKQKAANLRRTQRRG